MIKKSKKLLLWDIDCDNCHTLIATCMGFEWEKYQEFIYSPILCELCGQEHNKDVGDDVQRLIKTEKILRENDIKGYDFKYVNEKGETIKDNDSL